MIYSIKVIADGTTFTVGEKNPLDRMGLTTVEGINHGSNIGLPTNSYTITVTHANANMAPQSIILTDAPCYLYTS